MADLSRIVTSAVAIADRATASLQAVVQHAAFDGTYSASGEPGHATPVARRAIVEAKQELRRDKDGTERMSRWKLTFVEPLAVNLLDLFTLPDGTTPALLALAAPIDSAGAPFIQEVWVQ